MMNAVIVKVSTLIQGVRCDRPRGNHSGWISCISIPYIQARRPYRKRSSPNILMMIMDENSGFFMVSISCGQRYKDLTMFVCWKTSIWKSSELLELNSCLGLFCRLQLWRMWLSGAPGFCSRLWGVQLREIQDSFLPSLWKVWGGLAAKIVFAAVFCMLIGFRQRCHSCFDGVESGFFLRENRILVAWS